MKVALLVSGPQQVPPNVRKFMKVVTQENYKEIYYQYFALKDLNLVLFIPENVPCDHFLKFVEEFQGNLALYFAGSPSPVLLSRFNHYENRRQYTQVEFPVLTQLEQDLNRAKACIQM